MTRLFASLVPPADALEHLRLAVSTWTGPGGERPALRWTDPEQWHVTLAFYGDVPDGAVPEVTAALRTAVGERAAPALRLRGAGSFADRTLWVGLAGRSPRDTEALAGLLAASTAAGAAVVGGPDDGRERRRAHLTLARAGSGPRGRSAPVIAAAVRALAVYAGPVWRPEAVVLVSSRLGAGRSGGPLHEAVAELPFGGSPGSEERSADRDRHAGADGA